MLQAAFQEIHHSGFRSADLDRILAKAGVTEGAMYYHFDNKEAPGYAVTDETIASRVHQKSVQPLRNAKNPIDVLIRIFQSHSQKREDVQRGCELLNLAQEMSGLDEGFREGRQEFIRTGTTPWPRRCAKDRNAGWFEAT